MKKLYLFCLIILFILPIVSSTPIAKGEMPPIFYCFEGNLSETFSDESKKFDKPNAYC